MKFELKRIVSLLMTVVFVLSVISGSYVQVDAAVDTKTFSDINASEVFIKQPVGSVTCTLCSNAMMLRRAAIIKGDKNWKSITADAMYSTAWVKGKGVYWNYTYKGFSVSHTLLPTGENAKKTYLIELLKQHPEGVVLFDEDRVTSAVNNRGGSTHAVLLTDYTDGVFYYADPNPKIASGRLPMTDTATVTIAMADRYWYVKSNATTTTASKPVSVGSKPANTVKVISCTSVDLNKNKALLEGKGEKVGLTATVQPNNATNKAVVWKSSDTSVATVNSQGIVTAVGEGFVTITATTVNGGKVASCDVAVALEDIEEPEEVICLEKGITLKKCMVWYQQGKL